MKGICQPRPPGFSLRKWGWGGGRKGLFPSFSLSEGMGPGDEVERTSLREKYKQRFVYYGKLERRQPLPKGKP